MQEYIAIIGLGAAGMMAAATIHEQQPDCRLILIEKNAIMGHKVQISGGGRCNVTTGIRDVKELLTRYQRGSKFLTTAMYQFSPEAVYDWFEAHHVPLKTEPDLRVFPQSDIGKDVVDLFERMFKNRNIDLRLHTAVTSITKPDQFAITLRSGEVLKADQLILTTGGQAYRHTGSTGDGYHFAESLGHHITPLAASLNSFIVSDAWVKTLAGVSFKQVGLSIAGHKDYKFTGPIVFTHQGISGPAVFALSSQVAFEQYNTKTPLPLLIDFVPDIKEDQLRKQLDALLTDHPKQLLSNTLRTWLPKSVVAALFPTDATNAVTNKTMRQQVVNNLKHCPIAVIGRASGDEFVTAGGVELSEVDPRTMQSKICPGLYFAGELLNIDGYTGGFNLQAAWATGHLAGTSAATTESLARP